MKKEIIILLIDYTAIIISMAALLFTIFSFWWLHWRMGKIIVSLPTKFGFNFNCSKIVVQLPLVFYNTGAAAIIVNNLRLKLLEEDGRMQYLHFNNTNDDLESNVGRRLGYAFPVIGRQTYSRVFMFIKSNTEFIIPDTKLHYILEIQLNNKDEWKVIQEADLITPKIFHETMHKNILGYNNY